MYRHPKYRIRNADPLSPERVNEVLQPLARKAHRLDGHDVTASDMRINLEVSDGAFYKVRIAQTFGDWGVGDQNGYTLPSVTDGIRVDNSGIWQVVDDMTFDVTTGLGFLWINLWAQYIWHTFVDWGTFDHVAYNYEDGGGDDGYGANVNFAIRIDGQVISGGKTGHSASMQQGFAAIKGQPEIIGGTDLVGPQQPKSHRTTGIGPQCFPVRIFGIVPVTPGVHTVELVVKRPRLTLDHSTGWSSDTDRVYVYGRQAFIMEVPTWPKAASTAASVTVAAMQSEDVLSQAEIDTNRIGPLVAAYNSIPTGGIARGALSHRQLPRALDDWCQVSLEPGAAGVATDDYFPGYVNVTGTVVEGVANRTGQTGWYLLDDGGGPVSYLDTAVNHPAVFNSVDPGLFLILANIQCPSIERDGAQDVPSLFGTYAIAAEFDTAGTGVIGTGTWYVNTSSQALVNNFNIFGLPAPADDIDPEEMDVALMAIYDYRAAPAAHNILRFGVVAASFWGGGGGLPPPLRCRNRWRHGSMQIFRFRPGSL